MSLLGQLYQLQQLDIKLQDRRQVIDEVTRQLSENEALVAAESQLASQKQRLTEANKRQKDFEWELEDLQEKSNRLKNKLYSGTVKNPKELVNLENESGILQKKTRKKEDELLELMSQIEDLETKVEASTKELQEMRQEWQQKQKILNERKTETETELTRLSETRRGLAQQISSEVLNRYEQIKLTRGQAVAKVAQGRCQGCYITLPISQWQRARSGELVQCSSCNRILYVE
jgi:predicted  nucleic acid-binding Zn-ribbon protein